MFFVSKCQQQEQWMEDAMQSKSPDRINDTFSQAIIRIRLKSFLKEIEYYATLPLPVNESERGYLQDIYQDTIRLEMLLMRTISRFGDDEERTGDVSKHIESPPQLNVDDRHLTEKEIQLLRLFTKGVTYKEAAQILDCKISTIQTHTKHIYRKLGVHSRSEAVYEYQSKYFTSF
jgi:DNA-binding CsgD family transcriptional regulator